MRSPVIIGRATLHNVDCVEYMRGLPDKEFDLAIVDPPYFDVSLEKNYLSPGSKISTTGVKRHTANFNTWQKPTQEYFSELKRVSAHQIIWGSNYYIGIDLPTGRLVWDKQCDESSFSDGEIASCSLIKSVRFFRYRWNGMLQGDMKNKEIRIHPNQKPVKLYEWILSTYAKPGWRILDTHLGSGSHAIACNNLGFELTACEIDKTYFNGACSRTLQAAAQKRLFA